MAYVPLKKVCPDHSRWKVQIRAVRFTEKFTNDKPPKISKFEFVMLDEEVWRRSCILNVLYSFRCNFQCIRPAIPEQNTAMEAVIPPKWIDEQRPKLIEGAVYTIQYFEICNARAIYRAVDHPYMARFTKHTKISKLQTVPPNFPAYACCITPFHVLRARVGNREHMSGMVCYFYLTKSIFPLYSSCVPS